MPFVEIHNPTDRDVTTTLRSPPGAPRFGGLTARVTVPAGASLRHALPVVNERN
jgi:hypothetical protein